MKINIPSEKSFFGKKARLDMLAEESIEKVIFFTEHLNSGISFKEIEDEESRLEEYYYDIINSVDNFILPFWWEDFFSIESDLKSLVSHLVILKSKSRLISDASFDFLLKREVLILEKIKKYFSLVMVLQGADRRDFVEEITDDIKNLHKIFFDSFNIQTANDTNNSSNTGFDAYEVISKINARIIDSLNKINLGAAV